ncbi:hypothetical protein ABI_40880 [Asticcacaulis biprosthecium C19]|uniref:Uncharacterized protein n=1 Tax=Asticcacaulis biprosthecium C19 TaxID=715226 RepID=F4QSE5_9CAUL|nr:hypothetical protein [Asticcacaulis biprosthecium]EGF89665.1 hypothetical protein ABI_40880 [Asticcacaulis biprosthecium C19]
MAQDLVELLISDLDTERAPFESVIRVLVGINRATWPTFYSIRRIERLSSYVEYSVMGYFFDLLGQPELVARLSRLLEMASRRDTHPQFVLSGDCEAEHFGHLIPAAA